MERRDLTLHCTGPEAITLDSALHSFIVKSGCAHLWFATLDELRPRLTQLESLLDPVETERAQRFRFAHDRERFVLGHGALRWLLGKYLDRDGSLIRFSRGRFGKPYIAGTDLYFNFSDTKDAILIGATNSVALGIDVETTLRDVDHQAVSEHYFTTEEIAAIRDAGDGSKRCFLDYWTRKEAVLKASGVGIMDDLRVLRVDAATNKMMIEHEAFIQLAAPEYNVRTWHIGDGHIVSLAAPIAFREVHVRALRI